MSMSLTDARTLAATGVVSPRAARLVDAVNSKGAYVSVTIRTPVTIAAAHRNAGIVVEKILTVNGITGVEYRNLKQNDGKVTGALPNGQEWVIYPWISKSANGETEYARIYIDFRTATFRTTYLVDGIIVGEGKAGKDAIRQYMTPGGIRKMDEPRDLVNEPVATIGPKVQNVIAVNGITL